MRTTFLALLIAILCIAVCGQALCQARTTPVEVNNSPTVKVDSTANTVKSQQSGTWNVGVTGTPSVSVTNTPGVNVLNAPNVSVTNTPTVSINASANTVKAPTQYHMESLWTGQQTVNAGSAITSKVISCGGFKEARFVIYMNSFSGGNDLTKVLVQVKMLAADGNTILLGKCSFGPATNPVISQANFSNHTVTCAFTTPVMSNSISLLVENNNTSGYVTLLSGSWVYLVN